MSSNATATTAGDDRVLALFDDAGQVETPAPGVKAWLANDATNGRKPVLIKRLALASDNGGGPTGKGRATEALALLSPPIVRTRRWMVEGGYLYVVRDVVRGKNLRQLLAGNAGTRPSPDLIRRLILPVVDALEFAHAHGAVHGGVSPENVIVADDGRVMVTDWATADPKAPHHYAAYGGVGSVGGDVKALGRVLAAYLPTTGAFGSPVVRGKIEGVIGRCDTLGDLRETVKALEKLAAAPVGSPPAPPPAPVATPPPPQRVGPPPLSSLEQEAERKIAADGRPVLVTQVAEPRVVFVAQGGGGVATVIVRNDGPAPLIVRMIATQHAWLNVRPMDLPLVVAPNATERVEFYVSAARLSPGDYRSDVYLSANAGGGGAEDLQGGWYKHTTEVRLHVEAPLAGGGVGTPVPTGGAAAGCGAVVALVLVVVPGLIWAAARHVPALLQVQ